MPSIVEFLKRILYRIDSWADFGFKKDYEKLPIGSLVYFYHSGIMYTGCIINASHKKYVVCFVAGRKEWTLEVQKRDCIQCITNSDRPETSSV